MVQSSHSDEAACACKDGMFPTSQHQGDKHAGHEHAGDEDRRRFLFGAGAGAAFAVAATGVAARRARAAIPVPADPTRVPGRATGTDGGYGSRSPYETARRVLGPVPNELTTWSFTPLADQIGNITASSLHFERHHAGIPAIDPARHSLIVHGLVDQPKRFSMVDLKRLPRVTRRHFIECSGNTNVGYKNAAAKSVQVSHGLLSTSEWTGVRFSVLARELGIAKNASWVLAEGSDAAVMTRSIPMEKMMRDAILAYGQNGEAIRPEQGYPLRLLLPGFEGNTNIKWLRRLQVSDKPFMTREETAKYTDLMENGIARQFVFTMEAKSVITFPSGDMALPGPGIYEIGGFAWSGSGRVRRVEVSTDGGANWHVAALSETPEPMCTVRFSAPWVWDGKPAQLQSRCIDETGYVQPTHAELVRARGDNFYYHYNAIYPWRIASDGSVTHAV
jgi:sulfane dehydrogenase subunit SoxC